MRTRKCPFIWIALVLLIGCSPKKDPTLIPTLTQTIWPTVVPATVTATAPPPTATPSPTPTLVPLAARVNGQPILLADFEQEVARAGDAATRQQVMDGMIETLLLEQAATSAGVTVTDEQMDEIIAADIEAVGGVEIFKDRLTANGMTEEQYREQVRSNLMAQRVQMQMPEEIPETAEQVHARHIVVATQEEAEAILAQLQEGADFATLARTFSLDVSTRDRGGDLDFFPRGLLLAPELEEAAFSLAPGQISGVVESELLGYHIVQVLEREERPISEPVRNVIRENQIRRWREQLWANAAIERFVEP